MRLLRSSESNAPARSGVVGDVHACDERLAPLLDSLPTHEGVDAIWCVGGIATTAGWWAPAIRGLGGPHAHDQAAARLGGRVVAGAAQSFSAAGAACRVAAGRVVTPTG